MSYGARDLLYKAKFLERQATQHELDARKCRSMATLLREQAKGDIDGRHPADR